MPHHTEDLLVQTRGQGLYEITQRVESTVPNRIQTGLCTVFVRHTSASIILQENADPSARRDLEMFLGKLVPEGDRDFSHTSEGPDDMPSHIKAARTATSVGIPIVGGQLALGTWQGIYLWEHRRRGHRRRIVIHVAGD